MSNVNSGYVPPEPFSSYHWFWACKAPTEALNDPAVLFGVLRIINFLGNRNIKYNSPQFTEQLISLSDDVESTVNLSGRVGERNLMRNSGQYWSALNLIPQGSRGGIIRITDFGAEVATGVIDQGDFAALTIATFELPNRATYSPQEITDWQSHALKIHPLRLLLEVMQGLFMMDEGWLTPEETARVLLPMAADKKTAEEIVPYILRYRENPLLFSNWPNCTPRSNDMRFIREFFLFLFNYGYVNQKPSPDDESNRFRERYEYLPELDDVVTNLITGDIASVVDLGGKPLDYIKKQDISATVTSVVARRRAQRPGQPQFRQSLLSTIGVCPITNVDLPEVLEAAHIKPHAYGGPMGVDNGWPMRVDVHRLFDAGKLRIRPDNHYGIIEFTDSGAERNYQNYANKAIIIPEQTNLDYVKWRYDNYLVGMRVNE